MTCSKNVSACLLKTLLRNLFVPWKVVPRTKSSRYFWMETHLIMYPYRSLPCIALTSHPNNTKLPPCAASLPSSCLLGERRRLLRPIWSAQATLRQDEATDRRKGAYVSPQTQRYLEELWFGPHRLNYCRFSGDCFTLNTTERRQWSFNDVSRWAVI